MTLTGSNVPASGRDWAKIVAEAIVQIVMGTEKTSFAAAEVLNTHSMP
jgi:hypothetical protein